MKMDFKNYSQSFKKLENKAFKNSNTTFLLLIAFIISCICLAYVIGDLSVHMRLVD